MLPKIITAFLLVITGFTVGFISRGYLASPEKPVDINASTVLNSRFNTIERTLGQRDLEKTKVVDSAAADRTTDRNQYVKLAGELMDAPSDVLNDSMLNLTVGQWAERDAMAALEFALSQSNRQNLADIVMLVAGKQGDESVLSWLVENQDHPLHSYWAQSFFSAYAGNEPETALAALESNFDSHRSEGMVSAVVNAWAEKDVQAVFDWLNSQERNAQTLQLHTMAMSHYIEQSPREALNTIETLPKGDDKNLLVSAVADRLSKENIYDAVDWAESLPREEQAIAISTVMTHWATQGIPEAALDYLLDRQELQSNPDILNATIIGVAQVDTGLLIERQSEFASFNQRAVVQQIATSLINDNKSSEYESWFQSLPIGEMREAASIPYVEANYRASPSTAFKHAEHIVSAELRESYLARIAKSWARMDSTQARLAIESTGTLSEDQKRRILSAL